MLKSLCQGVAALAVALSLSGCTDESFYSNVNPPVSVTSNTPPAASSMHYGPAAPAAATNMHYGPPNPTVTVTNGSAANSMHYGN